MKVFNGFDITGPEVRWLPPSIARGRPYGFWVAAYGGHWYSGRYDEPTMWSGDSAGFSRIAITKRDANNRPLFASCGGPSWSGTQTGNKAAGDDYWEDRWETGRESPDGIYVGTSYKLVIFEVFTSSWSGYLSSVGDGLYARRRDAIAGIVKPYTDLPPCKPIKLVYG